MKIKKILLILLGLVFIIIGVFFIKKHVLDPHHQSYIKTQPYYVDILKGTIDEIKPTATQDEIVAKFPNYSSIDEKIDVYYNDGGGVFYANEGMFFYTFKDYIRINEHFIGNVSLDLMSKGKDEIPAILNKLPVNIENNFALTRQTFQMDYGYLVIESTESRTYSIEIHGHKEIK